MIPMILSIAFSSTLDCEYVTDKMTNSSPCVTRSIDDAPFVVRGVIDSKTSLAAIPGPDTTAVSGDIAELRRVQRAFVLRFEVLETLRGPNDLREVLIRTPIGTDISQKDGEEAVFFLRPSAPAVWNGLTVWELQTPGPTSQLRRHLTESTRSCGGIATQGKPHHPVYGLKSLGDEPPDCHRESESCLASYDIITAVDLLALGQPAGDMGVASCDAMHWDDMLEALRKRSAAPSPHDVRATP